MVEECTVAVVVAGLVILPQPPGPLGLEKIMNDQQKKAQEALEAAVRQHCEAFRSSELSEMVADWILVANVISYDDDGERLSAYNIGFSGGVMDEHRAVGLCHTGVNLIAAGFQREGE